MPCDMFPQINGFNVSRHTELKLTNARAGSTTIVRVYWESLKFNE